MTPLEGFERMYLNSTIMLLDPIFSTLVFIKVMGASIVIAIILAETALIE